MENEDRERLIRLFGEKPFVYVENNDGPDFMQCPGCGAAQVGMGYRGSWKATEEMKHYSDCIWEAGQAPKTSIPEKDVQP